MHIIAMDLRLVNLPKCPVYSARAPSGTAPITVVNVAPVRPWGLVPAVIGSTVTSLYAIYHIRLATFSA